ncbi:MAG: hypothetical protein IPK13_21165 [Deltaproteobacteria bacterium]|nr:hypothetical protein [Deltaproteobacteria bacterium]
MGANVSALRAEDAEERAATRTELAMLERLRTLEVGSPRYTVLASAIDFKRSWIEFAEHLTEVRRTSAFKSWGYRTFEAYAQHELHLRRETAQKLVRSYDFLSAHEADSLRSAREVEPTAQGHVLPDYQALAVLAEARQNPNLSEEDYRTIRDEVFESDPVPAQVRKMVRERAPEAPKGEEEPDERVRRCLALAERLYGMLLEANVPPAVCQHAERTVGGLRRLLDA